MPLDHSGTKKVFNSNVAELVTSYKKTKKIGTSKPSNSKKALEQALAIAYDISQGRKATHESR